MLLEERAHAAFAREGVDLLHGGVTGVSLEVANVDGSPDLLQPLSLVQSDERLRCADLGEDGLWVLYHAGFRGEVLDVCWGPEGEVLDVCWGQNASDAVLVEGGIAEELDQEGHHRLRVVLEYSPEILLALHMQ